MTWCCKGLALLLIVSLGWGGVQRLALQEERRDRAQERADAAEAVVKLQQDATARIAGVRNEYDLAILDEAALPAGDGCGLGVDRARILRRIGP